MTQDELVAYDRRTIRAHAPYQIIIRAIHERGQRQALALAELKRRGLWLTTEQRRQAGLEGGPSLRALEREHDGH